MSEDTPSSLSAAGPQTLPCPRPRPPIRRSRPQSLPQSELTHPLPQSPPPQSRPPRALPRTQGIRGDDRRDAEMLEAPSPPAILSTLSHVR